MTSILRRILFPTRFRVVMMSLGLCLFMNSCAKAENEEGKVIVFEKEIDLHSSYGRFCWSPDSRYIAAYRGSRGFNDIGIVDIETGKIRSYNCAVWGGLEAISWSPDQKLLAVSSENEIKILRLADGKVIAGIHIPYEEVRAGLTSVTFGQSAFSEDGTRLLLVSTLERDYAIINSFDLATGKITPLLLPSLPPLNPPPYDAYKGWKKDAVLTYRFYRYQGHLYFACEYHRLQEAWDYNFSLPLKKDGERDMEHYVMPKIIMVADLGDGKSVLSTTVLNFPDKPIRPGEPPPQDRPEFNHVFFKDYVPQLNTVIVQNYGTKVLDKRGTRPLQYQMLSMQREPLIRFGESWWSLTSGGDEVHHPSGPLFLSHEHVPADKTLRDTYIDTYALEKMPIKQQFVVYDLLTGKEFDRFDRHESSIIADRSLAMSGDCFSPDGQHFTYRQDGTILTLYKVTVNHTEN